ncbi:AP-4 complex subunit beta-1 [Actinomortierella ambigua]|nr:AP-4 complex subunit beta-1 [Actinomortierella ambigua]
MDVAELAQAFADPKQDKHFEIVQRVQELMGQGVDVSSLFLPMVSSASTRDIPTKKAAFRFLRTYGHQNEELCILGINTLHQDSADPDPVIRALALRTLCSLGQKNVLRFMLQPLYKGLRDKNAHVRKTAVIGCISIFELDPPFVLESEIVDRLYQLIRDRDGQVAVNAILALETILKEEGGMVLNQAMARYLLGRFSDWTSGQLLVILGILCRYRPETDEEIYDIMTQNLNEIQDQVLQTIFETLTKQLSSPVPEVVFASLDHLKLMVQRSILFYDQEENAIGTLFCNSADPTATKDLKIRLLGEIVVRSSSPKLVHIIVRELLRYATMQSYHDYDHEQSKRGVTSKTPTTGKARQSMPKQPPQQQRYERHQSYATESQVSMACRAIGVLGALGACKANFSPEQGPLAESLNTVSSSGRGKMSEYSGLWKLALEALLEAMAAVSGLEMVAVAVEGASAASRLGVSLKEADMERVLSAIVLAIEECWQARFNVQQAANTLCKAGGILSALQVKALGSILLRHLDQEELDRQAKKNKPLRMSYQDSPSHLRGSSPAAGIGLHATMSSISLASSTTTTTYDEDEDDDGGLASEVAASHGMGGLSHLARMAGIRILILEEALAQRFLQQQIQAAAATATAEGAGGEPSPELQRRQAKWEKGRAMREVYATLLQQQVQEMVQIVVRQCRRLRRRQRRQQRQFQQQQQQQQQQFQFQPRVKVGELSPMFSSSASPSVGIHSSRGSGLVPVDDSMRAMQLAVLRLACCLVATGLSTESRLQPIVQSQAGERADFLGSSSNSSDRDHGQAKRGEAAATDLASGIFGGGSSSSGGASASKEETAAVAIERRLAILDLLLDTLLAAEDDRPSSLSSPATTRVRTGIDIGPVSRDVRDRALMIRQEYSRPIKAAVAMAVGGQVARESDGWRGSRAVEAFVELYGVPESPSPSSDQSHRSDALEGSGQQERAQDEQSLVTPMGLLELERHDRLLEHGFNTLAVHVL